MKAKFDTIRTFLTDISELNIEENYQRIYERVPYFRREKADRLRFQNDKALSIGAWYLYILALDQCGNPRQHTFNLSHSGKYALCSIGPASEQVGCDVEMIGELHVDVAERFFCPSEYQDIIMTEEEKRTERYYRYWVLKESFMKATRKGMALGMDKFEIKFDKDTDSPYLYKKPKEYSRSYYLHEYECDRARIGVCSTTNKFTEKPEILKFFG